MNEIADVLMERLDPMTRVLEVPRMEVTRDRMAKRWVVADERVAACVEREQLAVCDQPVRVAAVRFFGTDPRAGLELHEEVVFRAQLEEPADVEAFVVSPGEGRVRFRCVSTPRQVRRNDRYAFICNAPEGRLPVRRIEPPELHLSSDQWNQPLADSQEPVLDANLRH